MPVTLDYMIYKDSIEFLERIDSSKIQTLAQVFPQFVLNVAPIYEDTVSFAGYRDIDSTIEIGTSIWARGDRVLTIKRIMKDTDLAWLINYTEDSSGENYALQTAFVTNLIKVKYDDSMPPLIYEDEMFQMSIFDSLPPHIASAITYSGAGDKAIFCMNGEIKEQLEALAKIAFGRTKKIISDHKMGEWLKR